MKKPFKVTQLKDDNSKKLYTTHNTQYNEHIQNNNEINIATIAGNRDGRGCASSVC